MLVDHARLPDCHSENAILHCTSFQFRANVSPRVGGSCRDRVSVMGNEAVTVPQTDRRRCDIPPTGHRDDPQDRRSQHGIGLK